MRSDVMVEMFFHRHLQFDSGEGLRDKPEWTRAVRRLCSVIVGAAGWAWDLRSHGDLLSNKLWGGSPETRYPW